jgi:ATP-dependent DNA helicase RecG
MLLNSPVTTAAGIGNVLEKTLAEHNINNIKDLLLFLPLKYIDRSKIIKINQVNHDLIGETVTLKAHILSSSTYYKNRKNITRAKIQDDTGQLNCIWFNNKFLKNKLIKGSEFYFSCKITDPQMLIQPVVEDVKENTLHTGRLVPSYSSVLGLKQGNLRRILKNILDNLKLNPTSQILDSKFLDLKTCFDQLHFPDQEDLVIQARERLAIEELIALMIKAKEIKKDWQKHKAFEITISKPEIPPMPFELTKAQNKAIKEILKDLEKSEAMSRILVGDVGSGKTAVAAAAAHHVLENKQNVALVAPTQILAKQHSETLKKLLPNTNIKLIIADKSVRTAYYAVPTLYIGTHALINRLDKINPALLIYDEQHRFGVKQRSEALNLEAKPHILTMSATPIPRSLMLTIFSHLSLSYLDEMPAGRKPTKTWYVPKAKKADSLKWLEQKLIKTNGQALIVCPFIDPSHHQAFENVAAATETYQEIKKNIPASRDKLSIELLHSKLDKNKKNKIIKDLFDQKTKILVSTPIVEVGVDLPAANIIIIEGADRFGMASLHQLRGRVGRAGQESFCLLFSASKSVQSKQRLNLFAKENDGLKLAELDLKNRGSGNIFGTEQHGLNELRFSSWTNLELINQARDIFSKLDSNYQPLFSFQASLDSVPMAN